MGSMKNICEEDVMKKKNEEKKDLLYIYNSMSGEKEVFKPKVSGKVGMYFCGITPYDSSHVGHARAVVAFDVIYRYLQYLGYDVVYVRNYTDVDDKIIRRANELNEDIFILSSRFIQEFHDDMNELQCLPPTHEPRVSDHIQQIIDMISRIISNECAYEVDGNVYYSVDKFPNYGRLSGQKVEETIAGKRVAVNSEKQNFADFALWKAAKPGEPSWNSPWGCGRPGWHIECSAMSSHYLTFTFDIHGGGMDLIFPHHENEIAQSWAACSQSNVNYWMHMGRVMRGNSKMSKSEGNFVPIREVTKMYHPLALRHFLVSTHYRSPVNYSVSQLDNASEAVYYIYEALQNCEVTTSSFWEGSLREGAERNARSSQITIDAQNCINGIHSDFHAKMLDDFQTPTILSAALPKALKFINKACDKKKRKQLHLLLVQSLTEIEKEVKEVLNILGLLSPLTYSEVLQQLKEKALVRAGMVQNDVLRLIEERALARKEKDYLRSDKIRSDLAAKGIALMDDEGTMWRPCLRVQNEHKEPLMSTA